MIRPIILSAAIGAVCTIPVSAQISPADSGLGTKLGMSAQNNSGQVGSVTLYRHGSDETLVVVRLQSASGKTEAAHVHRGRTKPDQESSCENLDPKPAYVLHPVVDGRSSTLVKASEDRLLSGNYVVNVHAQNNLAHYVSCGALYR